MAAGIEPCTTGLRVNHANLCAVARKQQQIEIFANSTFRIKNKKGETNFLFADNKKCFFLFVEESETSPLDKMSGR